MSWSRSSRRDAWERLVAARPPAWVLDHCKAVEALAVAMAQAAQQRGFDVDLDAVSCGALLHDIGRSVTQDVRHACEGGRILREDGAPEHLVAIVEKHTGAGITATEAQRLGLPPGDYVPQTLEERIVCHADNLHTGDKRLRLSDVVAKYEAKGLDDAGRRIREMHERLEEDLGVVLDDLRPVQMPDLPDLSDLPDLRGPGRAGGRS